MELERDERIVLDNGPLGLGKKLTLTNKRLIICEDAGVFDVNWKQEKDKYNRFSLTHNSHLQ